jgi:hypothetical protein
MDVFNFVINVGCCDGDILFEMASVEIYWQVEDINGIGQRAYVTKYGHDWGSASLYIEKIHNAT